MYAESMPWLRLHHVFALGVWDGRVYWSDWETRGIESCRRRPNPHYKVHLKLGYDLIGLSQVLAEQCNKA